MEAKTFFFLTKVSQIRLEERLLRAYSGGSAGCG